MAKLALLLTVAFVIYALRQDLRQGHRFSAGMWISFAWITIIASRPVIYWLHPQLFVGFSQRIAWEQQRSIQIIQGNPVDRNIFILLMILGLIVLMGRRQGFRFKISDNGWLIAFFAYCLISIIWSDDPGGIFKKWIRFIGEAAIILLILTETQAEEKVYWIFRRMAIILLPLSALLAKFYPEIGRIYTVYGTQMWVGAAEHKNSLGFLCAFTGIILVWRNLEKWPKVDLLDAGLLALTAYLLRGARSTTSIIVFLLGTALLVVQAWMKWDFRKLNRAIILGLCALLVVQVLAVSFVGRSMAPGVFAAAGKDASLTGRIPLWRELIKVGFRNPIHGYGFASFWLNPTRLSELWDRVRWTPTTAHNGYIQVFLDLGIIGLILLFLLLTQTYKSILHSFKDNPEFSRLKAVLFLMIFFHNFSESSYGMPSALLWLLFLLTSIVIRAKPGEGADLAPQPSA